jgi:hypothetical protein
MGCQSFGFEAGGWGRIFEGPSRHLSDPKARHSITLWFVVTFVDRETRHRLADLGFHLGNGEMDVCGQTNHLLG